MARNETIPGSAVILVKYEGREPYFLVARRTWGSHREQFTFPGGKGQPGETPEQTAIREVREETGIRIMSPEFLISTHPAPIIIPESPQSQTPLTLYLAFIDECTSDQPQTIEPEKVDGWGWINFEGLAYLVNHDLLPYSLLAEGWLEELIDETTELLTLPPVPQSGKPVFRS